MKSISLILIALSLFASIICEEKDFKKGGLLNLHKVSADYKYPFNIKSKAEMPRNYTWGNVAGRNYLTRMRNQHIPQYCGSCWAHATTSVMSDRISIMRGAVFPEINLAPQTLLDFDYKDQGCHGGDFGPAFDYIKKNNIVDEACSQYRAKGWEEDDGNVQPICKDCVDGSCLVPEEFNTYTVSDHGPIPFSEEAIMTEIFERGPVGCGVFSGPLEDVKYGFKGVFETTVKGETGHAISVVGWGVEEESGLPYWVMRNSWGEYFADEGYIKVRRGNNTINIEDSCYYANPKNTWSKQKYPNSGKNMTITNQVLELQKVLNNYNNSEEYLTDLHVKSMVKKHGSYKGSFKKAEKEFSQISTPLPQDTIMDADLPESFWWGDVDGVNYLSWTVNQHIPQYCGSCWAQGALGAMSDRINIQHNNLSRRFLSVQVLINCGVGDCLQGGDQNTAYEWIMKHGIPEYGCQNYSAKNPEHASCSAIQTCMNCPFFGEGPCAPQKEFTSWTGSEHGAVKGASNMKKELWARGPMACGMAADDAFYFGYKGGVYSSKSTAEIDHTINIVGWGKNSDGEYWIVRNSWGTYWGENGYFRIKMHEDNLRIEENCNWIVPKLMGSNEKNEEMVAMDN